MTKIEAIQDVQHATEHAMEAVIAYITTSPCPTSEEAHAVIDEVLAEHNCESPEGHIVAGGIQSAAPHEKGSGQLRPGEPIVIDIYPRSKSTSYYADMTRTICIGKPSLKLQKMYDAVVGAHARACSLIQPGGACKDLHNAIVRFFDDAAFTTSGTGTEFKYAEGFVHGLGHGVSTKIHDAPHINSTSKEILSVGDVITIEPGLYYTDIGGIRIEDMLLVTATGAQTLTRFPKTFIYNQTL